ncbi:methyl-accepting chemotaxis protein [Treponema pectinovorum]|uniref:methyl-accepting chemotaxis protein n=1 Tax=Treponema pectinovorum TaxID=164 RepID=UPI003D91E2B7
MKVTIKVKLGILVIGLILFSGLSIGVGMFMISQRALKKSVKNHMVEITSNVVNIIRNNNDSEFKLLENLAALHIFNSNKASLEERCEALRDIARKFPNRYENIIFIDKEGNTITSDGQRISRPNSDYFKIPITGKRYVSKPQVIDTVRKGQSLMFYSVPVYDYDNKIIGVIVSVVLGDMLEETVKKIDIGDGYHPYILDIETKTLIGNANGNRTADGNSINEIDKNSSMYKFLNEACSGKTGSGIFVDTFTNKKMAGVYRPIGGDCSWVVFCSAPYDYFFADLNTLARTAIILTVIVILIGFALTMLVVIMTSRPLIFVKNSINEIATGHADLTKRIKNFSNDEVGDVIKGFNKFTEKLQAMIISLKGVSGNLAQAGEDLNASTQDATSSITQILANINSVHGQINNQVDSVDETAGAVNEIASNVASLEKMVENQTAGVNQASAAVEQMIGNIDSVNKSMDKMAASFADLQNRAKSGSELQLNVNDKIELIRNQSQSLQEANAVISSIAEQTNLLAMNAAIEAAHAGEAGKGFSVVADEIRKLSETSTLQSKTIGEQLQGIQESIQTVVNASHDSSDAFMSVAGKIQETDELVRQIRSAMEEQATGSQQINEALHAMNDSTLEVRMASKEMSEGNAQILKEIQLLQNSSSLMKNSMQEMGVGAKKINETGSALSLISKKMADSIKQMGDEINLFRT